MKLKLLTNIITLFLIYDIRCHIFTEKESVKISEESLTTLLELANGDMRRAVTLLQSSYQMIGSDTEITCSALKDLSGHVSSLFLSAIC